MIVEEINASIVCPNCDYKFKYSALLVRSKIEDIYKCYLKNNLGNCVRCKKGKLIIKDVECILEQEAPKQGYRIKWECNRCSTQWTQTEYISKSGMANGGMTKMLNEFRSNVVCPCIYCTSKDKKLLGISKK